MEGRLYKVMKQTSYVSLRLSNHIGNGVSNIRHQQTNESDWLHKIPCTDNQYAHKLFFKPPDKDLLLCRPFDYLFFSDAGR